MHKNTERLNGKIQFYGALAPHHTSTILKLETTN